MSQFWRTGCADEPFKPTRLRNWEVPNWHPHYPERHCQKTEFLADTKGHLNVGVKKPSHGPWGHYKGTWDLPLKISRATANKIALTYLDKKKNNWKARQAESRKVCQEGLKNNLKEGYRPKVEKMIIPEDEHKKKDHEIQPSALAKPVPKEDKIHVHEKCVI